MRFAIFILLSIILGTVIHFQGGYGPLQQGWNTLFGKEKPVTTNTDTDTGRRLALYEGVVNFSNDIDASGHNGDFGCILDGASYDEISTFRIRKIEEYGGLGVYPDNYDPFADYHYEIYGQITGKENWLKPAVHFIANPYQLVTTTNAHRVTAFSLYCPEASIDYDDGFIEETYTGKSAECWFEKAYAIKDWPGQVWLITVNAWDAGFQWAYVDVAQSQNILKSSDPRHITNLAISKVYYYHVGQYGVNNLSPNERRAWVTISRRGAPTTIYVKLWQRKPASPAELAEMIYIVNVLPTEVSKEG
ncbi:MAG: hypothetical protein JEZ11_10350 [Desulfobacterales bacterium]|nr:hypothetical protein [Desulfobacterales bacterium]